MKKLLSLLLVVSLLLGLAVTVSAEAPETVDLKLFRAIFSASPQGTPVEDEWQRLMEDYLGVKLNITWEELPWGEFNTKMPTYIAAGEYADAFQTSGVAQSTIDDLGMQGQLINILDHLDEETSYFLPMLNMTLKNKSQATAPDGGVYGFADAMVSETDAGTQSCWAVRFDTFAENDLTIPTTMEEIHEAAKALKEIYPSAYPVTVGYGQLERWLLLNQARMSIKFDGAQYVYSPYRDAEAIREIVTYLNTLKNEGLLDPEWITDTTDQFFTKYLNGTNFISSFIYGSTYAERLNFNEEFDVEWGMINAPLNLKGEQGFRSTEHEIGVTFQGYRICVSAATQHPELVVKMIDYQYSPEMIELTNWGIEGVTYEVDADGNKDYTEEVKTAPNPAAKLAEYGVNQSMSVRSGMIFLPQFNDAAMKLQVPNPYYYKGEFGTMDHWSFHTVVRDDLDNVMPLEPARAAFDDLQNEDLSINKTALDTYVKEELNKFIMGERSLDEYDTYIAEMVNYGNIELVESTYNGNIITE